MMAALRNSADETPANPEAASRDGRLKRKDYEKELRKLQVELCRLQDWVKHKGLRVIIVFEGRDTAGKGGTIKALTERVSRRAKPLCSSTTTMSASREASMSASAGWPMNPRTVTELGRSSPSLLIVLFTASLTAPTVLSASGRSEG